MSTVLQIIKLTNKPHTRKRFVFQGQNVKVVFTRERLLKKNSQNFRRQDDDDADNIENRYTQYISTKDDKDDDVDDVDDDDNG